VTDQLPTSPSPSDEAHQALLDSLQEQLFSAGAVFQNRLLASLCRADPNSHHPFIVSCSATSWTGLATGIIELLLVRTGKYLCHPGTRALAGLHGR
jgi:hypothetical protein